MSVIVGAVEAVSVSPVTLGLSAATQEKVFPVKVVIATSSKSIFKVLPLQITGVGSVPTGAAPTENVISKVSPTQPSVLVGVIV